MDERQQHIIEDLSGAFSGEVRCDEVAVSMYACDASLFQVKPIGVAYPRHREDVQALARYATETNLPLIPRGSGTNVSGSSLGAGLVVDFSRHMNAIQHINDTTVTVQSGVVLERLNRELRKRGRYFPPDPSTAATTTIGGMLGVDAAGSRAVRIGSTRDHVVSIEVVLANGHAMLCGSETLNTAQWIAPDVGEEVTEETSDDQIRQTLTHRLGKVLGDNEALIQTHQKPLFRNSSGYFLRGIRHGKHLHLARMLVGSEGTLGLFSSATLHTSPLPEFRGVALLLFGQVEQAIDSVSLVTPHQPSACDLLDRRLLSLGRENDSRFEHLIPPAAEAGLLIEHSGLSQAETQSRIALTVAAVQARFSDMVVALEAYDFDDVEFLWELPRKVVPLLTRMRGDIRPIPFIEDVAIPPECLKEFYTQSQRALQKHEVTASLYSHAASGQIHMRPFMSFPRQVDAERMQALAQDVFEIAISLGGSISGEHGDGLARSYFVQKQYGPLMPVFREIKNIFDPRGLLNPGKVVTTDRELPVSSLRPATKTTTDLVELQLNWDLPQLVSVAETCNGCGLCRSQQDELRMCPFFRVDQSEDASPRAKANVIRSLLNDELPRTVMSSPEMERLASLCFNCKQCDLECPTNTRVSELMIEAKAQVVDANGLSRTHWFLSRMSAIGGLSGHLAWFVNLLLTNKPARWLMEKTVGIDRRRKLPKFATKSFIASFGKDVRSGSDRWEQSVVYFVDHFANYHDPELARAFLAIMRHHDIHVFVPQGQNGSGMAMVSAGDLAGARRVAEANLRELAEFARDGIPIVCTEPAAAICLRDEYPLLLVHPDTEVISQQTVEAGAFLLKLLKQDHLRNDFIELPIRVGYHTPCHTKALRQGTPMRELLQLIPGLELIPIEAGCSGMAGTFGLMRENFETSLAIGQPLIERMRHPDFIVGTTECSSCRLQMEHDSPVPTIHPIKLLAAAYGLLPKLRTQLVEARKV